MVAGPDFDLDYLRIDRAASSNPSGPEAALRRAVLRTMLDLANGRSDGHHALSCEPGKGDLRDCVTAYIRSDPQRPADYRLVMREIGPDAPGQFARRELLAIKPRRGPNNIYAHVCARLDRHPNDRQPGLDRFDRWQDVSGGAATRGAELDAKRAIAHAWAGQQPLRTSRPFVIGASAGPRNEPSRTQHGVTPGEDRGGGAVAPTGHPNADTAARTSGKASRARLGRPGPTGWPGRG